MPGLHGKRGAGFQDVTSRNGERDEAAPSDDHWDAQIVIVHIQLAEICRGAAEPRDLGRSRSRAALSRAISERRLRGGTPAQKRKGPVGATGLAHSLRRSRVFLCAPVFAVLLAAQVRSILAPVPMYVGAPVYTRERERRERESKLKVRTPARDDVKGTTFVASGGVCQRHASRVCRGRGSYRAD